MPRGAGAPVKTGQPARPSVVKTLIPARLEPLFDTILGFENYPWDWDLTNSDSSVQPRNTPIFDRETSRDSATHYPLVLLIVPEPELPTRLSAPRSHPTQPMYVSGQLKQTGRVMIKDEDVCLHCGLCAERCPTHAWDMVKFELVNPHAGQAKAQ